MRVLVCGGRDYADRRRLFQILDSNRQKVDAIIHGAARGADRLAGEWARARGVQEEAYPADWHNHGRTAGPLRNIRMLDEGRPDLVVAFPGGAGTGHMVKLARSRGVRVILVAESVGAPAWDSAAPDRKQA
jgi:hypothetical protein